MPEMRVHLIGTTHDERGLATVEALLGIIRRLRPSVLFAEIPSSHIGRYVDGSHGTLESRAVARYAAECEVAVVPVDLPEPDADFFRTDEEFLSRVERTSPAYRQLIDTHVAEVVSGGFDYLNSDRCMRVWAAINADILDTVDWLRDPATREAYETNRRVIADRDDAIIANILAYGANTETSEGVLLVGTAHREALIHKVRSPAGQAGVALEWILYGR